MERGWFRFAARLVVALAILAASFVSIALTLTPRSVDAPIPSTLSAERPVGNPATIRVQAVAGVRAAGQADEAPVALVDAAPPQGPIVLPGLSVGVEVAALPSAEFVAFGETLAETVAAHDGSTRYAIAVTDLQTGYMVGANHLRQQLSGCVMNLFVILQAVLDVQEGRYPLETVDALIRATTWSSNAVTARELYGITGGGDPVEGVRRVAELHEDLELEDMVIDHPPAYRGESVGIDPNNWLSASAVNIALEEIWQGDMLTAESRAYLLEVLAGVKPGLNYLTAWVPGPAVVSHKNGFFPSDIGYIDNDAGIVQVSGPDGDYAYAVTFLAEGTPYKYADLPLGQELMRMTWEYFAAEYAK